MFCDQVFRQEKHNGESGSAASAPAGPALCCGRERSDTGHAMAKGEGERAGGVA